MYENNDTDNKTQSLFVQTVHITICNDYKVGYGRGIVKTRTALHVLGGRRVVQQAIQELQSKTCVRLEPRTSQRNYIQFFHGSG